MGRQTNNVIQQRTIVATTSYNNYLNNSIIFLDPYTLNRDL
jgi:hypothetical protein